MGGPEEGTDYSSAAAELLASKEQLTHQDIEAAAQAVITAAAEARAREFDRGAQIATPRDFPPERAYEIPTAYYDRSVHQLWVEYGPNHFRVYPGTNIDAPGVSTYYGNNDPTQPEETQFEWIRPKIEYFGERWPSFPQTMAQHCDTAKTSLQSGQMSALVSVKDVVADWQGHAQTDFKTFFLDPYTLNVLPNQQTLLDEMAVALRIYEAILVQGRADAKQLADDAVTHLDSLNAGSGVNWGVVLGVAGVVVSVVSTIATAGSTTPLVLGLIGATVSAARVVEGLPEGVDGGNVEEVMESLGEVFDALRQLMEAEEESLAEQINISADSVQTYLTSTDPLDVATVLPNEPTGDSTPNLTDGEVPDHEDFHPD